MLSLATFFKLALVATTAISPALSTPVSLFQSRRDLTNSWGPIISSTWLSSHLSDPGLTILDLRPAAQYSASHIPNSINVPFNATEGWSVAEGTLSPQFPDPSQIQSLLAAAGINWPAEPLTRIAIVGGAADGPRVAAAIQWAGLPSSSYAVLSGGFAAWQAAGLPSTTAIPAIKPGKVTAEADTTFVSYESDVRAAINRRREGIWIVDARSAAMYKGERPDEQAGGKRGHIESAVSLPTPELWVDMVNYEYLDLEVLRARAEAALAGCAKPVEIHVYCHVGRLASVWYYLLNNVFGYEGVKLYDGSTQEWGLRNELVLPPLKAA